MTDPLPMVRPQATPAAPTSLPPDTIPVTLPGGSKTPEGREVLHLAAAGGVVYANLAQAFPDAGGAIIPTAVAYVQDLLRERQPRDSLEAMGLVQAVWLHAHLGKLFLLASQQTDLTRLLMLTEACERTAAAYRKHLAALEAYHRSPHSESIVSIQQANIAQQQVVNHVLCQPRNSSNQQGIPAPECQASLPPQSGRAGPPAGGQSSHPALAEGDGAADGRGQSSHSDERPET